MFNLFRDAVQSRLHFCACGVPNSVQKNGQPLCWWGGMHCHLLPPVGPCAWPSGPPCSIGTTSTEGPPSTFPDFGCILSAWFWMMSSYMSPWLIRVATSGTLPSLAHSLHSTWLLAEAVVRKGPSSGEAREGVFEELLHQASMPQSVETVLPSSLPLWCIQHLLTSHPSVSLPDQSRLSDDCSPRRNIISLAVTVNHVPGWWLDVPGANGWSFLNSWKIRFSRSHLSMFLLSSALTLTAIAFKKIMTLSVTERQI